MEGAQIGPYRVLGDLGSGGMGKVYLAEVSDEAESLEKGTVVALKVIHPHLLEVEEGLQRFLREAEIGKRVCHENVVRTYACESALRDGEKLQFLVMEYVEGQTLRGLQRELNPVPEELCRHIGREVAKGLAAIHETAVIHRDVKPENVLITDEHVVKVMDLGIARLRDEVNRISQTGSFVGSVEYASPEQLRGDGGELDERSDLYALGLVLYELATGTSPFRDTDLVRVMMRILEEEPARAGGLNPQLSPFFEEVVHTLLAKAREGRFPSSAHLLEALEAGEESAWWQERAQALRRETKRPLRRMRIPRETGLYGRDDDLARLRALYAKAKTGEGQVLLIGGEAGIGKTRLVDEFVGALEAEGEDFNFLFGSRPPGGAASAGAFRAAYRDHFGTEGLEETLAAYLTETPLLIPAFAALLKGDTTPTGVEPLTPDSLQTVFVHATHALAAERPTIVLIDDLHFASEDERALVSSIALAVADHRVLFVGAMRPGGPEDWVAGVTRLDYAAATSLSRLGPKDLVHLLEDAFQSRGLAEDLSHLVAQKSDGNPYFALEIIDGLREEEALLQGPDGSWSSTSEIRQIQVPSSVTDLIQARLGELGDEDRNLLEVASCCGMEFDPSLVGEVLGLGPIPALQAFGRIEKRHRLVRSAGRHLVFDQNQVQETLYDGVLEQLREHYHAAIAAALEARTRAIDKDPRDLEGALCVDLSEHNFKGAQGARALQYLNAALDHLEKGFLNDRAIALADRALDVSGLLEGKERLALLLRKFERLDMPGRREAQETALAQARALVEQTDDRASLRKLEEAAGKLRLATGRHEEARVHLERSLAIAREIGDRQDEARTTGHLGSLFLRLGRYEEAKGYAERWLEISREIGDRRGEAYATGSLGNVFQSLGRLEDAGEHYRLQRAVAREIGDRRGEAIASGELGNVSLRLGRDEEAKAYHERSLEISREIGDRENQGRAAVNLGGVLRNLGRYEEAQAQQEGSLAIAREIGDRYGESFASLNLGALLHHLGRYEEARPHYESALVIAREIGARYPEGCALHELSAVADAEDDQARALELANEALALRRAIGERDGVVDSLIQLGGHGCRAGDAEAAREALQEAVDLLREGDDKVRRAQALTLLACLPDGDVKAANAAREEAGESGNTLEVRFHLWKATGDHDHLEEAKRLLGDLVVHASEKYRASILKNVRLHREIMEAWEEHGEKAVGEADAG